MNVAAESHSPDRGALLLLEHCAALERFDAARPQAFERLEEILGGELARRLVIALAGDHRMRSWDLLG